MAAKTGESKRESELERERERVFRADLLRAQADLGAGRRHSVGAPFACRRRARTASRR